MENFRRQHSLVGRVGQSRKQSALETGALVLDEVMEAGIHQCL